VGRNAELGRNLFPRKALKTTVDDLPRDAIIRRHYFIEKQRGFRLEGLPRQDLGARLVLQGPFQAGLLPSH
jgi:hypothetical protein